MPFSAATRLASDGSPASASTGSPSSRMTALVVLGNALAHWLRHPDTSEEEFLFLLPEWVYQTLHLQPSQISALRVACESEMRSSPLAALAR